MILTTPEDAFLAASSAVLVGFCPVCAGRGCSGGLVRRMRERILRAEYDYESGKNDLCCRYRRGQGYRSRHRRAPR